MNMVAMPELVQGTADWLQIRCGKLTASRVAEALAKTKSGWGAGRDNVMAQLIAERLTGQPMETYTNAAMQWGTATEPQAREAYAAATFYTVTQVGFVHHPTIEGFGCSPDGLVEDDGLVEVKCPNTATHIDTLLALSIPEKYITQVQAQMSCTGRQWTDFVSFDPRMPENMRLFVKRVYRDDAAIKKMEADIADFLEQLHKKVTALRVKYGSVK